MSPFLNADKITRPLLLIHGNSDENSGTYPLQSRRMFAALKGLDNAPVRLVLLPHENHHYHSRESRNHVIAETFDWLQRFVRNAH